MSVEKSLVPVRSPHVATAVMVVVKVLQAAAVVVVVLAVLVESVLSVVVVLTMFSVSSSARGDLHRSHTVEILLQAKYKYL